RTDRSGRRRRAVRRPTSPVTFAYRGRARRTTARPWRQSWPRATAHAPGRAPPPRRDGRRRGPATRRSRDGAGARAGGRGVRGVGVARGRGGARACARRDRPPSLRPWPSSPSRPRTRHTVKLTPYAACPTLGSMFGVGMPELIVILVIALIVLGPKRLP